MSPRKHTRTKRNIKVKDRWGNIVWYIDRTDAEWRLSSGRWEWDPTDTEKKTIRPFSMALFKQNLPVAMTAGKVHAKFYAHPATTAVTKATVIGAFRTDDKIEE